MNSRSSEVRPGYRSRQSLLIVLLFSLLVGGARLVPSTAESRTATIEGTQFKERWLGKRVLTRAPEEDTDGSSSPDQAGVAPRDTFPLPQFRKLCAAACEVANNHRSDRSLGYRARAPPAI
jgi:hypothetical protein